jgi:hypothetical protein
LASFGADVLLRRVSIVTARSLSFAVCVAAILIEFISLPMSLTEINPVVPPIYQLIRRLEPGTLMELPVPPPDRLPGSDPQYVYWSTTHWRPMINGYSGYYPESYLNTLNVMTAFPSDKSIDWIKGLHVRYLLLHRGSYSDAGQYDAHMQALLRRNDVVVVGTMNDWNGGAILFELR